MVLLKDASVYSIYSDWEERIRSILGLDTMEFVIESLISSRDSPNILESRLFNVYSYFLHISLIFEREFSSAREELANVSFCHETNPATLLLITAISNFFLFYISG
jgi:hypothetical protein